MAGIAGVPGRAAELLAHWHMGEGAPPFVDAGVNGIPLLQDAATATASSGMGIEASAAYLNWVSGLTATRVYSSDSRLQQDSFGFSFWINPVNLNPFDSLLTKEMAFNNTIPAYARMAWQVHVMDNNGSGAAALQLIVRGDQRGQGDFFGSVQSSTTLPLASNSVAWFHVAGGYDARTGALKLYVNGLETVSGNSSPGAHNSDGSALALGSARNGADFVSYSAITFMDDVQIYAEPLSAAEVEYLLTHPGEHVRDLWITGQSRSGGGNATGVGFESIGGRSYQVSVGTGLGGFVPAASVTSSIPLVHDAATATALADAGIEGDGVQLRWVSPETSATRLAATHEALQTDSFGFSFWMKPDNLNPYDSLLTKEMAAAGSGDLFTRIAWQVHVMDNNGSGAAPLQFIVRGSNRGVGDFYGTAISTATVPLSVNSPYWVHVAGGYDALTGALRLYVNGSETVSGNSSPGADNSDGGALSVGSARNGPDFVTFAAATHLDDLQVYDGPLAAAEAAFLAGHPGSALPHLPRLVARWTFNEEGAPYADQADGQRSSWVNLGEADVDAALGPGPKPLLFFRVSEAVSGTGL